MSRTGKIAPEQLPILFVKNLNYEVSSDALWKLFDPGEDGLIRQIRQGISVEAKGTAYVVFWNVMDAKNALEKLNGYNFQNRYLVGAVVASTREDSQVKRRPAGSQGQFSAAQDEAWDRLTIRRACRQASDQCPSSVCSPVFSSFYYLQLERCLHLHYDVDQEAFGIGGED
ncbi:hypothetical protein F5Y04DRAFT_278401 [Hypomontagnella monticulosa]|nr:hypothetical protein F5Y04DRAFT_278401 [Hypomontagnella monticulosa]